MDLVQCRIVSDDVEGLAGFYARLPGTCSTCSPGRGCYCGCVMRAAMTTMPESVPAR